MIGYFRLMSQVGTIAVILLVVLIIAAVLYLYILEKKRKERSRKRAEERRRRREEALAKMREEEENGTAFKRAMEERNQVKQAEDPKQVSRTKDIDTLTNVRVEDSNMFQTGKHRFSTGKISVPAEEAEKASEPAPAAVQPAPVVQAAPEPAVVREPVIQPQPVKEPEVQPEPTRVVEPVVQSQPAPVSQPVAPVVSIPGFAEGPKPAVEAVEEPVMEEILSEENRKFDFKKWASQLDEEIEVEKPVYIETPVQEETAEDELTFEIVTDDTSAPASVIMEEKAEEAVEEISAMPSFVTRTPAAPVQQTPVQPSPVQSAPVQQQAPASPRAAQSAVVSAPRVTERAYQVLETVEEDHSAKEKEFEDITDVAPIIRQQQAMNKKPDIVDEVLDIPATRQTLDIPMEKPVQAAPAPAPMPAPAPAPMPAASAVAEEISDEEYDDENEEDYFDPDDPETIRLKKIALRRAERELRMKEKERYAAELAGVEIPETGYDEDDEEYDDEDDEDFEDETEEEKGGALRVVLWIIAALLSLFCVGAILYLMFGDFISGLRHSQETLQAVMCELPDSIKEPVSWFLL
ncbi:MAG: hypothetical protein J5589_04620 [Firmicutes bacterium]|nr:hypothetical protein [Bacillota bacterium]